MVLFLNLNKPRELLLQAASGLLRFDVDRAKQIEFLVAVDESGRYSSQNQPPDSG